MKGHHFNANLSKNLLSLCVHFSSFARSFDSFFLLCFPIRCQYPQKPASQSTSTQENKYQSVERTGKKDEAHYGWWYREGMSKVYRLHCTSNSFIMEFLLFDAMHLCIHKMWSVFNRNVWKINKQMFSCSPFILLNSQAIKITNFKLTFLLFLPDSCSVLFCLVMSMFHVHVCVLVFVERLLCPFLCTLRAFLFIWMYFDCNVLFRRPTFPFFFYFFFGFFFVFYFNRTIQYDDRTLGRSVCTCFSSTFLLKHWF